MRLTTALALLSLPLVGAAADAPPPDPAELLKNNTHVFAYTGTTISGPGAELLLKSTADAQFVLFGEEHMDHAIPIFAAGLYATLHEKQGFKHLVLEQAPVAIEDALAPAQRGDLEKIAAHAKKYPQLYEFDTDEDLALLALAGRLEKGPEAICGVEQATSAIRYLEELATLARNDLAKQRVAEALAQARAADSEPKYSVNWLIAPGTSETIERLQTTFKASAGTRADELLRALGKSAEIFGYYRRADAGEFVGLFNNTVREEELKANFVKCYRAAAKREPLPKAMFKFGANHLYHGRNPTNAHPIGNLAHELAIVNGSKAYGLYVLALGPDYVGYKDFPDWMKPILPAQEPTDPVLVNLDALRRYQRLFRDQVAPADQWMLRDLMNGYQALVLLPGSKPGERKLGGR
jgi:hypothetical protein